MKKIVYTIAALCMLHTGVMAQREDKRTVTTRVADALAMMPAKNAAQLTKNMEELAALGKPGLVQMASMLVPAEKGDNTALEYALGGFTYYVTQPGKEALRKMAAEAYGEALGKLTDSQNKVFLIYQLQTVGKNESVPVLQSYLKDEKLSGPAARALVKIGTPEAGQALLSALNGTSGTTQLSLVEALGDSRFTQAAPAIEKLVDAQDNNLRKVALYSLASIGAPSSEKILAQAADKATFIYNEANATAAYLYYLSRLAEGGNRPVAEKAAADLLKKSAGANQVHTRTAALKLLVDMQGEASVPTLISAMGSDNAAYRAAALKYAQAHTGVASTALWLKALKKAKPNVQAEIINMMGMAGAKDALPAITKAINSKDNGVKLAAIKAAGRVGQDAAINDLMTVLKKGSAEEVQAVKNALLTMKGNTVVDKVAATLPSMPAGAQAALIDVLAARAADTKMDVVLKQLNSSDAGVKKSALAALKHMATQKDLPTLFTLMDASGQLSEVQEFQNAVIAAVKGAGTQAQQADLILKQMNSTAADKKNRYYQVLASVGGDKALQTVVSAYNGGDAASKLASLTALTNWTDASAANELYTISKNTTNAEHLDQAVQGYVKAVSKAKENPVQKVLKLRKALEVAKTSAQKEIVLKELQRNRTFNAMLVAGDYLDDPQLQQAAAQAVMNIALANKEYQGDVVRNLLNKTIAVLKGQDSEYQKESIRKHLAEMPKGKGYVAMFNGKDLTGWKGLVENPIKRAAMHPDTLAAKQAKADAKAKNDWIVRDGELVFTGHGDNLASVKKYGDIEMYVDWKIQKDGDAGIYLRGTPQVQIWDTARVKVGAQVGSGGLYNNQKHESKPLKVADNAVGEWNTFYIKMIGDRVTVHLNGELVVDNVPLENYWDRKLPIFPEEQIELQAHGTEVAYRDIYVRELPRTEPFKLSQEEQKEGFKVLFDGTNMHEWTGNTKDYVIEDGNIVVYPDKGGRGNLFTKDEYSDFVYRFEFQLTPGANNGLGVRAPMDGDAAYTGMELQILDNEAPIYKNLHEYQFHGSVYGVIPAKRGYLKPTGEWNYQEVRMQGSKIQVILNGTTILDGDIAEASKNGTLDHKDHPGLKRTSGHIGFLGHGDVVRFRNIRIKDLSKQQEAKTETAKPAKSKAKTRASK
ncbi:family 16 glycoside hydrolase [Telluribacter humicola]|uniref:family 16 glycoside hydrolase n=1 Tax=Telluribacter humicola TaxID=1720261 RepID=UPI001A96B55E|nr:family 16 glycoside hydrolase [Telluribacter humicola]